VRRRAVIVIEPLLVSLLLLLVWHLVTRYSGVSPYVLPPPERVLARLAMVLVGGEMYPHLAATLAAIAAGYFAGAGIAFILGALVAEFRTLDRLLRPCIMAFQAVPKVSIAPLIFIWVGFGIESTIILVALICFFPVFVNTSIALHATNPNLIDLMRSCTASRFHTFWHVKLPDAAGQIFAGLQIAVIFALIGCVVMEFINAPQGLGFLIQNSASTLDTPMVFACVLLLAVFGVAGTQLMRFLQRWLAFWAVEEQTVTIAADHY
jgi:NitT/TauT family transport system permease protein